VVLEGTRWKKAEQQNCIIFYIAEDLWVQVYSTSVPELREGKSNTRMNSLESKEIKLCRRMNLHSSHSQFSLLIRKVGLFTIICTILLNFTVNTLFTSCMEEIGLKAWKKSPLGRTNRRCENNIRLDLREVRWEMMNWMQLAQDRKQRRVLVNTVMNLRVP